MPDRYGDLEPYSSLPPQLNPNQVPKDGKRPGMLKKQLKFYDTQIAEMKTSITRLENKVEEIEEQCGAIEVATDATDAETADTISKITKVVRAEQSKVDDLKKRIKSIEVTLKEETEKHNKKGQNTNEEYNLKRLSLLSKIKVLDAKINVLEDFKRTQPVLQEKLSKMARFVSEEQDRVKIMLEKIERKFKLDREKLKKDMYNRLLGLAGTFQIDVSKCMSPPVYRLLRENLMLRNDIDKMGKMYPSANELEEMEQDMQSRYHNIISASIFDTKKNIISIKIQKLLINLLKEKNKNTKEQLSLTFGKPKIEGDKNISIEISKAMRHAQESDRNMRQLKVSLNQERGSLSNLNRAWKKIHCKVKRLLETIFDLKLIVTDTLQMDDTCSDAVRDTSEQLVSRVLTVLDKTVTLQVESAHTIQGASTAYIIGDLGFEPKSITEFHEEGMIEFDLFHKTSRISELVRPERKRESMDDVTQVTEPLSDEDKGEWEGSGIYERYILDEYESTYIKNKFRNDDGEMMEE